MTLSQLLYSALKSPVKFVRLLGSLSKNVLYIMSLILLLGKWSDAPGMRTSSRKCHNLVLFAVQSFCSSLFARLTWPTSTTTTITTHNHRITHGHEFIRLHASAESDTEEEVQEHIQSTVHTVAHANCRYDTRCELLGTTRSQFPMSAMNIINDGYFVNETNEGFTPSVKEGVHRTLSGE